MTGSLSKYISVTYETMLLIIIITWFYFSEPHTVKTWKTRLDGMNAYAITKGLKLSLRDPRL